MLNISNISINRYIDRSRYKSLWKAEQRTSSKVLRKALGVFFGLALIFMFIPWTQNIRARGNVTTLKPDQRPQTIHSVIGGRIEKWFVQEGDFVEKGDTILFISEVKDDYFDPNLLGRTQEQLKAKEMSVGSYMEKVRALDKQIDALVQTAELKLQQTKNKYRQAELKVVADSMDYQAYKVNFDIARTQMERFQGLYDKGLKSLTDLENKRNTMQKAQAEMIAGENKLLTSRNELINAEVELVAIQAKYRDEIAKAESDKYTAMSSMYDAEAVVTKLQNQYMNYSVRTGMYYITAPQDGYITKAIQSGIGETIKEGTPIISIMPSDYDLAVAMYIRPIDLPLLEKGSPVRIQFDGWPAIVFSGWPNTSYGTYGGRVFAIDNFISDNGKYRVLVAPDEEDHQWPEALRVGAGANNMLLLKDVPIWYELWRQINGFPPDYYKPISEQKTADAEK
ncbi:MAG: HlyD family efflux transporter periplasmic adaptor subunit [Flavobacteriales bacterium]|nr:HlyD family efflux transporter periplasmic adaptor subunit [Flavobacteriales bacterium]MCB9191927.1 HlyD family efflux transporter periplasmic adaptor subunit [Flavobacteriales bacterium]